MAKTKKQVRAWIDKNGELIGLIIKETMTRKEFEKRYGIKRRSNYGHTYRNTRHRQTHQGDTERDHQDD